MLSHGVGTGHRREAERRQTLDPLLSGWWRAPYLRKPNHKRRDHQKSDPARREPRAPHIPIRRRGIGMQQGHGRGTSEGGGRGCEAGSGEKAAYATQVAKRERLAEPPFE